MSTYVDHTDAYRSLVYAGARDGWYANPGGNLRAGLQGDVSFGRYDVIPRLGEVRDTGGPRRCCRSTECWRSTRAGCAGRGGAPTPQRCVVSSGTMQPRELLAPEVTS